MLEFLHPCMAPDVQPEATLQMPTLLYLAPVFEVAGCTRPIGVAVSAPVSLVRPIGLDWAGSVDGGNLSCGDSWVSPLLVAARCSLLAPFGRRAFG